VSSVNDEMSIESSDASEPQRITYLVKRLESAVRHSLDATTDKQGLTTPQFAALSILHKTPGLSSAQLARRSFVTAQSMQVMVQGFVKSGYIERRKDEQNARVLHNYLTDLGREVVEATFSATDRVEARMLEGLTPAQVAMFRELLEACVTNLRGELKEEVSAQNGADTGV